MCTVVLLKRPNHPWPLIIGANRDEMAGRPWRPPARHWQDRPNVIAGLDELAGGSWLGRNDEGLVAAILNRMGTLGPQEGKRSRGELVLEALDHADAVDAAEALRHLNAAAYRPFNMVVADNRDAYWLRNDGRSVQAFEIPDGVSILTAFELNDMGSDARIRHFLPRFQEAAAPDPESGDWSGWQALLGTSAPAGVLDREAGLCFQLDNGFGTRSSALLALPAMSRSGIKPVFQFAEGPPSTAAYQPVHA
jgi:uncharacterized protein with NRDE domain